MGSAKVDVIMWKDVPDDAMARWRAIFDASTEGLDLSAPCPVCGSHSLHRWFHMHTARPSVQHGRRWAGSGSEWQWCSACGAYQHMSGLVPQWWQPKLVVPEVDLRHDPGPIETARGRT